MDESILTSIKKMLGISESDTNFDTDIIIHINSVFTILYQLGVGNIPFSIEDESKIWSDYLGSATNLEMVKTYIYMKVKLIFDPPLSSSVIEAMKNTISEFEWRTSVMVDPVPSEGSISPN